MGVVRWVKTASFREAGLPGLERNHKNDKAGPLRDIQVGPDAWVDADPCLLSGKPLPLGHESG